MEKGKELTRLMFYGVGAAAIGWENGSVLEAVTSLIAVNRDQQHALAYAKMRLPGAHPSSIDMRGDVSARYTNLRADCYVLRALRAEGSFDLFINEEAYSSYIALMYSREIP